MKYPVLSAYLSSARNDALEEVDLREEVFGVMKILESTNPSVRIDKIDDNLSIYHKTSDAQLISFVYEQSLGRGQYQGRKRLELEKHLKGLIT